LTRLCRANCPHHELRAEASDANPTNATVISTRYALYAFISISLLLNFARTRTPPDALGCPAFASKLSPNGYGVYLFRHSLCAANAPRGSHYYCCAFHAALNAFIASLRVG